jgi:hypothetical protein
MLACCEEIPKEKKSLSCQTTVLDFFRSSSGLHVLPPVLLDTGDNDADDRPTVQEEMPPPLNCHLFIRFHIFCKFFISTYTNIYSFLVKTDCLETSHPF